MAAAGGPPPSEKEQQPGAAGQPARHAATGELSCQAGSFPPWPPLVKGEDLTGHLPRLETSEPSSTAGPADRQSAAAQKQAEQQAQPPSLQRQEPKQVPLSREHHHDTPRRRQPSRWDVGGPLDFLHCSQQQGLHQTRTHSLQHEQQDGRIWTPLQSQQQGPLQSPPQQQTSLLPLPPLPPQLQQQLLQPGRSQRAAGNDAQEPGHIGVRAEERHQAAGEVGVHMLGCRSLMRTGSSQESLHRLVMGLPASSHAHPTLRHKKASVTLAWSFSHGRGSCKKFRLTSRS